MKRKRQTQKVSPKCAFAEKVMQFVLLLLSRLLTEKKSKSTPNVFFFNLNSRVTSQGVLDLEVMGKP